MTLHEHRSRFERRLTPFVEWCARRGIEPNLLTVISLLFTLGSAAAFYLSGPERLWLAVVASALLAIGATLDSADGLLARTTDRASALGDFLDHAFDRFADVALLVGLTFSAWAAPQGAPAWVAPEIGLFAIVGTLLTSYMGTQAQAVGVGRDYGGLVGRADRMIVLTWTPILQVGLELGQITLPWNLNLLWLALAWIAVGGNLTALQRFWAAYQDLAETGKG